MARIGAAQLKPESPISTSKCYTPDKTFLVLEQNKASFRKSEGQLQ